MTKRSNTIVDRLMSSMKTGRSEDSQRRRVGRVIVKVERYTSGVGNVEVQINAPDKISSTDIIVSQRHWDKPTYPALWRRARKLLTGLVNARFITKQHLEPRHRRE